MMDPTMRQAGAMPEPGIPMGADEADVEPADADPGFVSARDWVADKMFVSGKAADKVANIARAAGSEAAVMEQIADIAYTVIDNADAQAKPPMKEENLFPLAAFVLEQLWETVAAALNLEDESGRPYVDPAAIAGSFKMILLRFAEESGMDVGPLKSAMDQITPEQFRGLVSEIALGGAETPQPAGPMPPQGGVA